MNKYRSHNCGELNIKEKNKKISLSGWINKKRDHGNLLFLDLRDNYGITQCVVENNHSQFKEIEKLALETVIKISGKVLERSKVTINKDDLKLLDDKAKKVITEFSNNISSIEILNKENLEPIINDLIKSHETNFKGVGQPLRIILTGSKLGPGIYDIISSLGKNEVIKRLNFN